MYKYKVVSEDEDGLIIVEPVPDFVDLDQWLTTDMYDGLTILDVFVLDPFGEPCARIPWSMVTSQPVSLRPNQIQWAKELISSAHVSNFFQEEEDSEDEER